MNFEQLYAPSLKELFVQKLQGMILSGELPMGEKLPSERELCQQIDVYKRQALIIASDPNSGSIMGLVENAWGVFGAAFGPVILLSLFWKRLTFGGTVAGIAAGAAVDILWLVFLSSTDIYEIVPGFAAGLLAAVVVSLL